MRRPGVRNRGFFMTRDEQMAIVVEVMEDRSLPNRPRARVQRMKELGLNLSHAEMMFLWQRYRHERGQHSKKRKRIYVGIYVPNHDHLYIEL